jgi:competence protein ComEC
MNTLLRFTLAFGLGVWAAQYINVSFEILISICAVLLLIISTLIFTKKGNKLLLGTITLLLGFALGCLNRQLKDETRNQTHLSHFSLDSVDFYQARVLSPPESRRKTYKIEVEIINLKLNNNWQPASGKVILYLEKTATPPQYGQEIIVKSIIRPTEPPRNPGEFDYQRFLSYRQFFYTQYVKTTDFRVTNRSHAVWYKSWAYKISQWSDNQLKRLIVWPREYAVAKAMVLGIRDEMDNDLVQAYSVAGAVHVLSVSGFHIAIFVWILSKLLGFLEKRKQGRWLYLAITLITMWFYAVLTGLSAPVIRSALMFTIYLLAKPLRRKENTSNALFGSALILLVFDPLLIYSVSFQLSYLALSGIIFLHPMLYQSVTIKNKALNWIWNITVVAFTAQLATFPLVAFYFHQFSTYFWLANPAVVGLSFLLLPLAFATITLSCIPVLSQVLGWLTTIVTWLLNEIVIGIDSIPFSVLSGIWFTKTELILVYIIIGFLLALVYYQQKKWLWRAVAFSVLLFGYQIVELKNGQKQQLIVVHNIPHQTVLSLIEGQWSFLIADSTFFSAERGFDFYLDNFYTELNLRHAAQIALESPSTQVRDLPFGKLIVWQNKKIVIVEQPIGYLPIKADLIIVRNTAFKKIEILQKAFGSQRVVVDNSNKPYAQNQLYDAAKERGLNYYFTNRQGAWIQK